MKKPMKCDRSQLTLTIAILISGIQLEATDSSGPTSVWIHIIDALLFVGMAAHHVFRHFGHDNWFSRTHRQKSLPTRTPWWVSLIALISGMVACHSTLAGHVQTRTNRRSAREVGVPDDSSFVGPNNKAQTVCQEQIGTRMYVSGLTCQSNRSFLPMPLSVYLHLIALFYP